MLQPLAADRAKTRAQHFYVGLSTGGVRPRFGETDFGLEKLAFELRELVEGGVGGRAARVCCGGACWEFGGCSHCSDRDGAVILFRFGVRSARESARSEPRVARRTQLAAPRIYRKYGRSFAQNSNQRLKNEWCNMIHRPRRIRTQGAARLLIRWMRSPHAEWRTAWYANTHQTKVSRRKESPVISFCVPVCAANAGM